MDVDIGQREQVQIEIEARDKGVPMKSFIVRMDIEITKTINAYPQWVEDYSIVSARLSENAPVNTIVKRLKATSSIPDSLVNYIIQPGETPEQNGQPRSFYYRIDDTSNEMILLTYRPLDYEALPQYTLTIKAAVSTQFTQTHKQDSLTSFWFLIHFQSILDFNIYYEHY